MDITVARIIQLISRAITFFLTIRLGIDSQHAASIATPTAEAAGSALTLLVDLAIHSGRFGWLSSFFPDPAPTSNPSSTSSTTTPPGTSAVKLLIIGLIALGLTAGATGIPGCAQSETNRVAQSIVGTQANAQVALQLHNAGVTNPAQESTIDTLLKSEAAAEDAYYASIRAGDSTAMKTAKAAWAAAVAATANELSKYTLTPGVPIIIPPATQPTTLPTTPIIPPAPTTQSST